MKRLLIVSFGVPPTRGPNPPRAWHLARHLPTFGWEAIVLTPRHPRRRLEIEKTREHRDYPIPLRLAREPGGTTFWLQETEYRDLVASWRKEDPAEHPDQELPGLYGKQTLDPEELALEPPPPPPGTWHRLVASARCSPDTRAGWIRPAALAARAVADALKPDAIYSVSPPVTAHCVASRIASIAGIPWVADFHEDWKPSDHGIIGSLRVQSALRGAMCAELPPSFDPVDLPDAPAPASEGAPPRTITLLHAGSTAKRGRDVAPILDAVRRLLAAGDSLADAIRLRFLGAADPGLAAAIGSRGLGSLATREPAVPWEASIQTQAAATFLLLALGPGDEGRIPDRAVEALTVRRPILAFGHAAARTLEFLRSTRAGIFDNDPAVLADAIARRAPLDLDDGNTAPYLAVNVTERLVGMIEKV